MSHYHRDGQGEAFRGADSPCSQCRAATCPDCGSFKAGVWTCWDCSTGRTKAMEEQDDRDEAEIAAYVKAQALAALAG